MAWTDPRTWVAGETVTAAQMNTHVRDNLKAIGDPLTAYTPVWDSSGTNPTLGNGTITGRYLQAGKLVFFSVSMTFGTTTTVGTGFYRWTLPVTAIQGAPWPIGQGIFEDVSASQVRTRVARLFSTTKVMLTNHDSNPVDATSITWANNDKVQITGTYEAA